MIGLAEEVRAYAPWHPVVGRMFALAPRAWGTPPHPRALEGEAVLASAQSSPNLHHHVEKRMICLDAVGVALMACDLTPLPALAVVTLVEAVPFHLPVLELRLAVGHHYFFDVPPLQSLSQHSHVSGCVSSQPDY